MFISHDLAVVEILSRRIAVLHHGHLVEMGTREQILSQPIDDYTKRLLAAVPVPDPAEQALRREQRDKLLAAGIGVEPDEFAVFPDYDRSTKRTLSEVLAAETDNSSVPPDSDRR